mmetsp:Transcript_26658/g.37571  ORF Transcript_26658/g.37571 Transcript_26658/m.37571 type:complete len:194 (+) Transcript_26658:255-836(+)
MCTMSKVQPADPSSDTRLEGFNQQHLPLHVAAKHLMADSSCDACACCEDTCGDVDCVSCAKKTELMKHAEQLKRNAQVESFPFFGNAQSCNNSEKYFTMCQLKRHDHAGSAWLLAGDTIYDATTYIKMHPGGERSILRKAGGCCNCKEDLEFHSKNARKLWNKYKIGKLRVCPGDAAGSGLNPYGADESCTIS